MILVNYKKGVKMKVSKLLIFVILSLVSVSLFSFELFDIRSGMSKDEVKAIFANENCLSEIVSNTIRITPSECNIQKYNEYPASYLDLSFNADVLWSITISFLRYEEKVFEDNGIHEALISVYGTDNVTEYTREFGYSALKYWVVILHDEDIYSKFILEKKNEFINKLKPVE